MDLGLENSSTCDWSPADWLIPLDSDLVALERHLDVRLQAGPHLDEFAVVDSVVGFDFVVFELVVVEYLSIVSIHYKNLKKKNNYKNAWVE